MEHTQDHDSIIRLITEVTNIKDGQDNFHVYVRETLSRIEEQVKRTNGRVTVLENVTIKKEEMEGIKNWMTGAKATNALIGALVIAVVIPVLGYFAYQEQYINVELQKHLSQPK
jgi:hypothetical protein